MQNKNNSLSLIVFEGEFTRVHYALSIAAVSAAADKKTVLFFAGNACVCLTKNLGWKNLKNSNKNLDYINLGQPDFEQILKSCIDLSVSFMICEMGLSLLKIKKNLLRNDVNISEGGLFTFLQDSSKGQIIFI
tara:strand:+ start:526 stop:924 length:399 start_codon:yes stop_codon:yes gene_type:complete